MIAEWYTMNNMTGKENSEESTPDIDKPHKKDYIEIPLPKLGKNNLFNIFLILLLMGMSFALGSLYTKMRYLEQGGNPLNVAAGADKQAQTVDEAFALYAKQLSMDTKKFQACLSQNKYAARIAADSAEASQFGVNATPAFFINGLFLGGAYPVTSFKEIIDKILADTASENYLDYSPMLQQAYQDTNVKSFDPVPKTIPAGIAPIRGNKNAKVTIVEYSDFQCPFCARANPTMKELLSTYKDKVRLAYKQYPLPSLHPNAQKAAEASECANEQGKFWEFHDLLFQNQQTWSSLPQTAPPAAS